MRVFIDSSILIEFENGRQPELFDALLASNHELFINAIVASEYLYRLLGILGEKSPMSVAESGQIRQTLDKHQTAKLLSSFNFLNISKSAVIHAIDLMKEHNLLPNDALILATCKLNTIAILASYDTDFREACQKEGVRLIKNVEDL
jgi:uncharacterized protein